MKYPPMIVNLKVDKSHEGHSEGFRLWIPLFILGPIALILLLALLIIALPFLLLFTLFTWDIKWWRPIVIGTPLFFRTMHELPGLKLDIEEDRQNIKIDIH